MELKLDSAVSGAENDPGKRPERCDELTPPL